MSFLTAPTTRDVAVARGFGGMGGVLQMSELVPQGGFQSPANWPPPVGAAYHEPVGRRTGLSDWMELSGLGQGGRAVPARRLRSFETARELEASPERFSLAGMGAGEGRAVPVRMLRRGEFETPQQLMNSPEFFGLGARRGFVRKRPVSTGNYLQVSPRAVPVRSLERGEFETGNQLVETSSVYPTAQRRRQARQRSGLSGLGQGYADPNIPLPSFYADPSNVPLPEFKVGGKVVARYAAPSEAAIRTAYLDRQVELPAFYEHPQLGPWGVDPRVAYQYWWAQQMAMQSAPFATPMAVWGSPGFVPTTPALPATQVARPAAFDPYTNAFPVAGTAVENF